MNDDMTHNKIIKNQLYLVATPIGNLGDITYRAVEILKTADIIYCEDTRVTKKLCERYDIDTPLYIYNDHNGERIRPQIIEFLKAGKNIALVSDAGMPLISDPGYKLVREIYKSDLHVTVIPGATASLSALSLSGFPTDSFYFVGFCDGKKFENYKSFKCPLIFYESPKKIKKTLLKMKEILGNRDVALVREITKMYEEVIRGSFDDILNIIQERPLKGEMVLVLGPPMEEIVTDDDIFGRAKQYLKNASKADVSKKIAKESGLKKGDIYKKIIDL